MNHCTLRGRLAAPAEQRTLPSGDIIVTFRIVVPRTPGPRVDTIDCVATGAQLQRRALALPVDTVIEVEGALHRRFFRAGAGVASRYEVAVGAMRKAATRAVA